VSAKHVEEDKRFAAVLNRIGTFCLRTPFSPSHPLIDLLLSENAPCMAEAPPPPLCPPTPRAGTGAKISFAHSVH
jgi:hypothetical protein